MNFRARNTHPLSLISMISTLALLVGCGGSSGDGDSEPSGGAALDCDGSRIWVDTENPGLIIPNSTFLVSEGAALFTEPSGNLPCGLVWEFDEAANCSLLFTNDGYIEALLTQGITTLDPNPVSGQVNSAGNLELTFGGLEAPNVDTFIPANISIEQLADLPDCT